MSTRAGLDLGNVNIKWPQLLTASPDDEASNPLRQAFIDRWPSVSKKWVGAVDGFYDSATGLPFFGSDVNSDTVWDTDYAAEGDGQPDTWGMFAYDLVWLYARGLDSIIKNGGDPHDGALLRAALLGSDTMGIT